MKVPKHKIYFFLLVINLLIYPATTFSQSEHPYIHIFEKASDEFNVPKPLLMALGWCESHWSMRYGQPTIDHAYGIMGLCSREDFDSLTQAANLIGLAPDMLKYDPESNIRGASALLRHLADEITHEGFPSPDKRVETWENVLIRYRGLKNYFVGLNYIYQIFYCLNFGVKAETAGGEVVYIPKISLNFKSYRDKQQKVVRGLSAVKAVDYSGATWVSANSNNYTTANRDQDYPIKYIIIHVTEGSYSGTISWFQNSSAKVSAHYVIRSSDGEITQMVRHKDIAWHAGNWDYNTKSIGIEHEGYVNNSSYFTEEMYKASASLTRYICDFYNIPKDRSHIIGHNEVPGATHTDPGSYWNWDHYMELVSNNATITKFNIGDTVEVYNTSGVGLKAWTDICSGTYIVKSDGAMGTVLQGPQSCGGYNRWKIRWTDDSSERWSAEDWLRTTTSCTYSLSLTSQSFSSSGGTGSVGVTASSSSCSWTAVSNTSWITITSGSSGSGNGTVSYSVSTNTSSSSRTGYMTIGGNTFTVTQDGQVTCTYSISPTSRSHGSGSETGSISVTTNSSSCSWQAYSDNDSWITITSGSSGTGNGTVYYSVSANSSSSSRTGTITIYGASSYTFTVYQSGSCSYSLSSTSQSFNSSGGGSSIGVTASSSSCSWTAVSNTSWITITSGSSGTGDGTVYYSVSANTGTNQRTGTMTIAGQNFTVTQDGAPAPTPTPPPTSDTVGPTGSISINSNAAYTNSTAVTLSLSASDKVGVTGYYLSTSSSTPSSSASGWTSVSSTTSYSGSVSYTFASGDETKTVYVWYKDAAGNVSSTASDSIILDTTAPIVTITSPTSGDTYTTTSSTITLSGSTSDGSSGVSTVTWNNDKGGSGTAGGTSNWSVSSISLSSGDNKITVTAKDNAGNTSTDTITVIYSTPTATPTPTPTSCTDSYEPNNSTSEAYGPLNSGSSYSGKICSDSDEDWFKVNITSTGTISLSLTVPSSNDYDLELYDPSYAKIASSLNGTGASESISYSATTTGNYYIKIYGFSGHYNTSSSYTLTYTYTVTSAPTPTPTPTTTGHTAVLWCNKSEAYQNGDSIVVTVGDWDLNTSSSYADTGRVKIKSNSDTTGFILRITETNVNSGTFKSTFMTADTTDSYASPPKIAVVADDTITVSYVDDLTATGNSTTITNTITVTGTTGTPTPEVTPTPPPPETGIITGIVINSASGVPIPGATVSTDTGGFTEATGVEGTYTIANVTPGDYTLTASATGFDSSSQTVTVTADSAVVADFALVSSGTGTPTTIEASVSIKPKTINLKSKGKFKAYIELPSSYNVENIYTDTVVCNGALAISARVDVWNRFIAKFNVQDLELNNYRSKKAQFTVSGELTDGTRFEGSDMVKIKFK